MIAVQHRVAKDLECAHLIEGRKPSTAAVDSLKAKALDTFFEDPFVLREISFSVHPEDDD